MLSTVQTDAKFEKVKASIAEIIVSGSRENPYYEVKYFDLSDMRWHIGYSSYNLSYVFEWLDQYFDVVGNEDGWVLASEHMPKEEHCIDSETGYYGRSDDVLCSAYDEYEMKYETWIDHTVDGEWQAHEWYEEERLAWMPLPEIYVEQEA